MKIIKLLLAFSVFWCFASCTLSRDSANTNSAAVAGDQAAANSSATGVNSETKDKAAGTEKTPAAAVADTNQPKTVREYFMLLPEKYFVLEGCERAKDKDCKKAKIDYLNTFKEVEDNANAYLKAGCDGAQSCLEMALFKRPDGTFLVAVNRYFEMGNDYFFLDYKNGNWTDVSTRVIPEFSKKNIYEIPRQGTTVKVYRKIFEKNTGDGGDGFETGEKGEKLYDLVWKDGKFSKD